jgi:hypothetical protein
MISFEHGDTHVEKHKGARSEYPLRPLWKPSRENQMRRFLDAGRSSKIAAVEMAGAKAALASKRRRLADGSESTLFISRKHTCSPASANVCACTCAKHLRSLALPPSEVGGRRVWFEGLGTSRLIGRFGGPPAFRSIYNRRPFCSGTAAMRDVRPQRLATRGNPARPSTRVSSRGLTRQGVERTVGKSRLAVSRSTSNSPASASSICRVGQCFPTDFGNCI